MATVEINLTGGTYKHKSLRLSAQVTRNFYPQRQEDDSTRSPYILESFYGKKLFGTTALGADRGMLEHRGVLYRVVGQLLFSVDNAGVHTNLGTIPGGERCILQGINANVVIVTAGRAYQWDGATVTEITDVDLETPDSCAHLNNQMIYDGDGGRFGVSDVGDATSIDGLNYATAESNADALIRVTTFDQLLYLWGEKTIETWWNDGVGNPPFSRVEGGIIPIGLGALHGVSHNDKLIYFLGDDNDIYALTGSTTQRVTTQPIAREIAGYSTVSDAQFDCFNLDGQWMLSAKFPSADKTWIYPEGGEWFEWSSGTSGGRNKASSYAFAYRKHLVADENTGDLFELDHDTFTENGDTIVRVRDSGVLHGGLLGVPGKKIEMDRFELIMQNGVGLLSGQGSDPKIIMQVSDDGGATWSTERFGSVAKLGEYVWKIEFFNLGTFTERIIRIKTSDPVYFSIHSALADLEPQI